MQLLLASALLLLAWATAPSVSAEEEPLAVLLRATDNRENWFRQGRKIYSASLAWHDDAEGPRLASVLDVEFLRAGERWLRAKEQAGVSADFVLPRYRGTMPTPMSDFPEWAAELKVVAPLSVDVTDGGRHLAASSLGARDREWRAQLNVEMDRYSRRGACNGWLMWSEEWLSVNFRQWKLLAVEGAPPAGPSGWLFLAHVTEGGILHFVRVRCAPKSMLPIEMVWSTCSADAQRSSPLPPSPAEAIILPAGEAEKARSLVVESTWPTQGLELPALTMRQYTYGMLGPCYTRFEYEAIGESAQLTVRFDPRARIEEADGSKLSVYDPLGNELTVYDVDGTVERSSVAAEQAGNTREPSAVQNPGYDLIVTAVAMPLAVLILLRRRSRRG